MQGLACSSPCGGRATLRPPAASGSHSAVVAAPPATCRTLRQRGQRRPRSSAPRIAAASSLDDLAATGGGSGGRGGSADAVQPPADSSSTEEADPEPEDAIFDYVQHCQEQYGKPGLIDFSAGKNNLPKVTLQHPSGASCELYLHGGTVTSWRHADGREMLHVREQNNFDGNNQINGGIQIAWPQYGVGPLKTHGFLQNLHWSVIDTAWREPGNDGLGSGEAGAIEKSEDYSTISDWRPTISLYADTDDEWAKKWPHKFEALYSVTLMQPDPPEKSNTDILREAAEHYQPWKQQQGAAAQAEAATAAAAAAAGAPEAGKRGGWGATSSAVARQRRADLYAVPPEEERQPLTPSVLRCLLQVHNCDDKPFTFTTGLRTHFATKDIPTFSKFVKTLGLRGKYVLDYARNPLEPRLGVEDGHNVTFEEMTPLNRLYVDCEADGDVLFCPGSQAHFNISNAEGFSDIAIVHPTGVAPREARRFVSIASARAVRKVTLQPGGTWVGEMVVTAHDEYWPLPAWEQEDSSGVPIPEQNFESMTRRPSIVVPEY